MVKKISFQIFPEKENFLQYINLIENYGIIKVNDSKNKITNIYQEFSIILKKDNFDIRKAIDLPISISTKDLILLKIKSLKEGNIAYFGKHEDIIDIIYAFLSGINKFIKIIKQYND